MYMCYVHMWLCVYVYICMCVKCLESACWSFAPSIQCVNVYMSICLPVCMYLRTYACICMCKVIGDCFCFIPPPPPCVYVWIFSFPFLSRWPLRAKRVLSFSLVTEWQVQSSFVPSERSVLSGFSNCWLPAAADPVSCCQLWPPSAAISTDPDHWHHTLMAASVYPVDVKAGLWHFLQVMYPFNCGAISPLHPHFKHEWIPDFVKCFFFVY